MRAPATARVVKVAVPSWRPDVHGKADLVEEIVRIVGVDRVPMTPFERGDAPRKPVLTPIQLRTRKAKRALAARGMVEAVTWSFISKPQAELFGGGKPELALANPIAADLSDMRPSLMPGLVAAAQAQCRSRLSRCRRCSKSARCSAATGRRTNSPPPRGVRRALAKPSRHRTALVELGGERRCLRRQGRCARGAGRRRRADAGAAGRARRPGLAASRPLRHDPDRPAERARPFRRAASARARSARRRRPAGRLRGDPRSHSRCRRRSRPAPSRRSSCRRSSRSTRDFAFIVDRSRQGRRHRARGARRRPQADHRRHACSTSTKARASRPARNPIAIAVTMQPREKTMTDAGDRRGGRRRSSPRSARRTGGVLRG